MDMKISKTYDRRLNPRWIVDASEEVVVQLHIAEHFVSGNLLSIGKNGLVLLSRNLPALLGFVADDKALQASIVTAHSDTKVQFQRLYLKRIQKHDDDAIRIYLVAQDDETKAQLWQFTYGINLRGGERANPKRLEEKDTPKIPGRGHYTEASRQERIQFIRQAVQRPLIRLDSLDLVPERLSSNIENLVGSVEIPVGLAGPLQFNGEMAQGIIYAPFATTEGALVASVTRGATVLTRSGGVTTRVLKQQMIRVPSFRFQCLAGAIEFSRWVVDYAEEISKETRKVSRFANLVSIEPILSGTTVHVRFIYETGDAAGQNMTTTCTWHACMWMIERLKMYPSMAIEHFMIEANVSGDKKANYMSFLQGRGTRVTAESFIYEEDLQKILKVKSSDLVRAFHLMSQGSVLTGMVGMNVNIANVIGAIFAATGQDIACVHESSLGVLNIEDVEGGIYASMLLPCLIVGTVGGGTALPDQDEFLQMIGCKGSGQGRRLAEIIAGYCLALDLSTLAALASGQFATAHEKLGRNRPVKNLAIEDINVPFFKNILQKSTSLSNKVLVSSKALPRDEAGNSIITELTSRRLSKFLGLLPVHLHFSDGSALKTMVKIKPLDSEVLLMMSSVASMCHPVLAKAFRNHQQTLGFAKCHQRELAVFRQTDKRFTEFVPECYGVLEDPSREIYLLVLENIEDIGYMNAANNPSIWNDRAIQAVIDGMASFQAIWWKRDSELLKEPWLGKVLDTETMKQMTELWDGLAIHAALEFPEWFDQDLLQENALMIQSLGTWWKELESMPRTLIHNDFNPRNLGLRESSGGLKLCAYDWELATLQVPQHDLAEFLIFVLSDTCSLEVVNTWVGAHREALMKKTGDSIDLNMWRKGFALSLRDLMINRVPLYIMAHTLHHYKFIRRITLTARHLIKITSPWT